MKNLIFLLVTICFISCEKNEALIGKWNWVQSSGGYFGSINTPSSTGKNIVLEISYSAIKTYENGILISEHSYSIKTKDSIFGGKRQTIAYQPFETEKSFIIENNKLYLHEECYDCFQHEYTKQ